MIITTKTAQITAINLFLFAIFIWFLIFYIYNWIKENLLVYDLVRPYANKSK